MMLSAILRHLVLWRWLFLKKTTMFVPAWPTLNKLTIEIHACNYSCDNLKISERITRYLIDVL